MDIKEVISGLGLTPEDMKECPACKEQNLFPNNHKAFNSLSIYEGKYSNDSICSSCSRDEIRGADNVDR